MGTPRPRLEAVRAGGGGRERVVAGEAAQVRAAAAAPHARRHPGSAPPRGAGRRRGSAADLSRGRRLRRRISSPPRRRDSFFFFWLTCDFLQQRQKPLRWVCLYEAVWIRWHVGLLWAYLGFGLRKRRFTTVLLGPLFYPGLCWACWWKLLDVLFSLLRSLPSQKEKKKSTFPPSIFMKVRFFSLNSKTE